MFVMNFVQLKYNFPLNQTILWDVMKKLILGETLSFALGLVS